MKDFDDITEAAAALFTRALEEGLPTAEFFRAWDKVMADVLRQYPGASTAIVMFAAGLALGRFEGRNGCHQTAPSSVRLQ